MGAGTNKPIKIGLLAYSTDTGLGTQTLNLARNLHPYKILITDLSIFNRMPTHHERFDGLGEFIRVSYGMPTAQDCDWLSEGIDILFVCETPLNYDLFSIARGKGVKIVLQFNYEFLDYLSNPSLPKPDILASPSSWHLEDVINTHIVEREKVKLLPVPVEMDARKAFRNREGKPSTLGHIAGRLAAGDRNGTEIFLDFVIKYHYLNCKFLLFIQIPRDPQTEALYGRIQSKIEDAWALLGNRFEVIFDCQNNLDMYSQIDILIMPRRYGGLCLPMWEALSCGVPVIMPAISPNTHYLPSHWLTEPMPDGTIKTRTIIELYKTTPEAIYSSVKSIAHNFPQESATALNIAKFYSWENLKDSYLKLFEDLVYDKKEDNHL